MNEIYKGKAPDVALKTGTFYKFPLATEQARTEGLGIGTRVTVYRSARWAHRVRLSTNGICNWMRDSDTQPPLYVVFENDRVPGRSSRSGRVNCGNAGRNICQSRCMESNCHHWLHFLRCQTASIGSLSIGWTFRARKYGVDLLFAISGQLYCSRLRGEEHLLGQKYCLAGR